MIKRGSTNKKNTAPIYGYTYIRTWRKLNACCCQQEMLIYMTPTQLFKCLSDDTRLLSTLLIHSEGELCVCELMTALEDSQPKISRHLAQLRSCGLLADRRDRQWVYYRLHPDLDPWITQIVATTAAAHKGQLGSCLQKLKTMQCRPERCA
jgi:ArsR family transcriptional regulator